MNKEKTYNGNLNIGEKSVSVETDHNYQGLEIGYVGTMNITSLLPDNYIVANGNNKIIIVKTTKDDTIMTDLFNYRGKALITNCKLVKEDLTSFNLYVNKSALELWNTLSKTEMSNGAAGTKQDWAYLTRDWENIEYDGNNNKLSYIHRKTTYDKEAKTYTTVKEIRKK